MSHLKIFLVGLLLVFSNEVSAQQIDSTKKLPPVQWVRSRTIDVKHIAIDLQFDWAKKQAFGIAKITFSPLNSLNKITLDAGNLTINSISLNEKPLKFNYDGGDRNDGLEILLNDNYTSQQTLTIKIDYHTNWVNQIDPINLSGTNGRGLRFSKPTSNDPIKPKEIWSIGEPDLNRYWFPSYDAPNDLRTTEFKATVEKDLMAISNGNLISIKENADGTHTFYWKTDKPYANHLTNFVVCKYANHKQNFEGIALNNYGYPHEQASTQASVERLPDMVKFFSEKIGAKYPYSFYSQAFVQDLPWGIAGNGLAAQTENMVDDYGTHADYLYLWDGLEGESLASQWFGNYLTAKDWSHTWLNKGFARYFSGLYNSYKNGQDEFLFWQVMFNDQFSYNADWSSGNRHPIVTKYYENPVSFTSDSYSYNRGAMVLRMLHQHLGDEKWWKSINHYVKTNANKTVETEDFRKAIEEATGESMDWFFDQWIYKMGHPVFEITKNYDEAKQQLTLKIKQAQKTDPKEVYPQVAFFQGKIEVEIDDKIKTVWLEAKAENVITLSLPKPQFVNFDFQRTWIGEISFEQSQEEMLALLKNSKDILARRSTILELIKIAKNDKTSANNKAMVLAGIREVVLSNAYWRLRASALAQLQGLLAPATETKPIFDEATTSMILSVIKNEKSWLKSTAIAFLGMTKDLKYVDIYVENLKDPSDRVISSAAVALGKTKSPKAFDDLEKLMGKPSMKSQSRLCALNGLKELGDPRGVDVAYKALSDLTLLRWRLPNGSIWDYRVFAVQTIVSLGKTEKTYKLLKERFDKSMAENDLEGIFNNTLLIATLGDIRGQEIFELLKAKYKDDANALLAIEQYEMQSNEVLKTK
jgi:aminopeptidase N